MIFSLTGIVYLFGFATISLLVNRFYQYWLREKNVVGKIFFIFLAIFDVFFLVAAVGGLFFAQNSDVLKIVVILSVFLQTLAGAVFGYLLFYLKFPEISPWWGCFLILMLGLPVVFLTIKSPFAPFLENPGSINWDFPPNLGLVRYLIFLISLLPYAIYCYFKARENTNAKIRYLMIGNLLVIALFIAPLDFFLNQYLKLGAFGSDIAIAFIGFSFLIVALIIPNEDKPLYVKQIQDKTN